MFQAQFRLIDDEAVRGIAGTGDMRGPKYRYACAQRAFGVLSSSGSLRRPTSA